LLLAIKARLASVEAGIETFEAAFMPYVVLPDGRTVATAVLPMIESAYQSGQTPAGLLAARPEHSSTAVADGTGESP